MKFKVGVLGATGYIGMPYRKEIRESGEEIVALCARRRDLLEAAQQEDNASLITDDWRKVVTHPDVNLILILTPDALHYEAAMECAKQGKHLLCEKPVGLNANEAREIQEAYRESSLAHYVPYWTRYVPAFARAREIFQSGKLGEIRAVVYRWHNPRPLAMPFTWRDNAELSAAGSIADVGSHAYDCMRWILNQEATRVLTHAEVITDPKPFLGEINLEEALQWGDSNSAERSGTTRKGTAFDYATIAFELESGAVGTLMLSHAPYLRKGLAPELELHGSEASLAVDRFSGDLTLARSGQAVEKIETHPHDGWGNRFAKHVFPALRAQIDGEECEHPNLHDGWRVQLFTDAAVKSARKGGWIKTV